MTHADAEREVGAQVRRAREQARLSQRELADAATAAGLSWHQTTVAKVEAGDRPLRLTEAAVLARVLGTEVAVLAGVRADDSARRADDSARRARMELELLARYVDQRLTLADLGAADRG